MPREVNLFEAPLQMCYCVPGGASRCGPCQDRAANIEVPPISYLDMDFTADDPCPECKGAMEVNHRLDGCTCFINPPCGYCTEQRLICTDCGLEIDYEDA